MSNKNFIFTSESVTEGHPDKMADRVSDAILDALLEQDPKSRVAVETLLTTGLIVVAGEVTTSAVVDYRKIVRDTVRDIGFTSSEMGFDADTCGVVISLGTQSQDIAVGVNVGDGLHKEQGAGDQGLMFGFATDETEELMPLPITLSHKLTQRLTDARRDGTLSFARPDGKSQVSVCYEGGVPKYVDTVVVSTQHDADVTHAEVRQAIIDEVILKTIPADLITDETIFHVNPTGKFVVGGPMGDAGLTGRKIIVDTYGGWGRHGGGAFSGKDPSKVDRSATYFARYVAKNVVAAGLARRCEVQVAYAIGVAQPVSVLVDTQGTALVPEEQIQAAVREVFDFRPQAIIEHLNLLRPIYKETSAYGHFGRSLENFTWERTDRAAALRELANAAA